MASLEMVHTNQALLALVPQKAKYSLSVVLPFSQHKFGDNWERGFYINSLKSHQNLFNFVTGELLAKDEALLPVTQPLKGLRYQGSPCTSVDKEQVHPVPLWRFPFPCTAWEALCTST